MCQVVILGYHVEHSLNGSRKMIMGKETQIVTTTERMEKYRRHLTTHFTKKFPRQGIVEILFHTKEIPDMAPLPKRPPPASKDEFVNRRPVMG